MSPTAKSCRECYLRIKGEMPVSRDTLKNEIRNTPFVTIGKQYNVNDNTIRKWCIKYNLPYRSRDIKQISDEDWVNV